jgi:hypothetical protein
MAQKRISPVTFSRAKIAFLLFVKGMLDMRTKINDSMDTLLIYEGAEIVKREPIRKMSQGCRYCLEANWHERSKGAIRNLVLRRAIPYRKPAGRLIFLKEEIDEWIKIAPGKTLDKMKDDP